MDQPTLVIEWTHRLLAAITVAMVALLVLVALRKRGEPGSRDGAACCERRFWRPR